MVTTFPLRLLHVMAGAEHGGAESYCVQIVTALAAAGVAQRVILKTNASHRAILEAAGVSVLELPFDNLFDASTRGRIRQEMRDFQPTIVQTWMYQATRATPTSDAIHVGWLRGYTHLQDYRRCDHLVAMTKGIVSSVVQQGWPAERIHHIRPSADDTRAPALDRAVHDTPPDAPLLLSLGRLHWHKAFDTLLQVLAQIPEAYLWIAGEGEQRENLENFAREIGVDHRVRFLGWQEDRAPLFAAADMVVVSSRYEPFGLVVIEAWAQHKPLIVTKAAGPRATVQNEVDGLLVPIDDVDAMARAIRLLLDDKTLREGIARRGAAHFERDYTIKAAVAQFLQFYTEVSKMGIIANRRRSKMQEWQDRLRYLIGK
jgi:glycosyltransferase involved in cell wall biosynthesis